MKGGNVPLKNKIKGKPNPKIGTPEKIESNPQAFVSKLYPGIRYKFARPLNLSQCFPRLQTEHISYISIMVSSPSTVVKVGENTGIDRAGGGSASSTPATIAGNETPLGGGDTVSVEDLDVQGFEPDLLTIRQ